ncbi:tumor suppressor candidate 2 isoform X1 [Symphalangus syndactylus]|uniref:tumor suppressor candidate 2 isoform X1 n=1 Tax=Symphalangus syndactylus TaxID=9590 RepID=UPI0030072ADE
MGASGSKARGLWPFASAAGGGGSEAAGAEQALVRPRSRAVPPFVFTRRGSMFYDEDGDLAHEFYEETIVTKNGQKRAKLRRVHKNLIPQVRGWAVVTEPTQSVWRWTQMGSVVMVGAFAGGSGRNKEAS